MTRIRLIREAPLSRTTTVKPAVIAAIPNFGDLLRYLRQRAHLTQRDLALAVGYSISQISRLEHNERLPDELTLLAVFVPALGLEQEPATVERLLALARQARGEATASLPPPAPPHATVFPAPAAPPPTPKLTNLPHRLTSFIGREQEVTALQRLVQEQRLVTLTGVGGVGKSSLALAVAETLTFPDGIWLLELAPLTEGGLVARALVDLFKLPEFPGRTPLEAVTTYLQHKDLLLIVDNCEHLIATCADLVERLLQAAPRLHVVTTSREALNIAGEREWSVLPLATPNRTPTDGSAWPLQQLQRFAAAQLFVERAQAVKADLRFTDADAPLIAHLCQQLDGIPLTLELAAARCKSFTLAELVARLHDRFALLSAGRRTALLRHQTLRATIDWSYDLLSPADAALFRYLSVFAGGWTMAAAEAVADDGQRYPPTFDLLHQLVNKSLVIVDTHDGATRYRMLETIRQYANEKLQESGEREAVCNRHFAYYLALAEKALGANLLGASFYECCNELRAELDNLRAAITWSQSQNDHGEKSLRLATALGPFWEFQQDVREGSAWLESALTHADPANAELYSWGIVWLAYTLLYASPRAIDLANEALQRFTALNQPAGMALANLLVGRWATVHGEVAKAIDCLQHALVWFEAKQSLFFLERTYYYLADVFLLDGNREQALHYYRLDFQLGEGTDDYGVIIEALEGIAVIDPNQVIALYQQQVERHRQQQNQIRVAELLHSLGRVFTFAGDLPGALTTLTEAFALWQKLGIIWSRSGGAARTCMQLGRVHHLCREYQQAMVYAKRAIQLYEEAGVLHGIASANIILGYSALAVNDLTLALPSFHRCLHLASGKDIDCTYVALVGLAEIARCQEKPALAACLFGAAERFAQQLNPIHSRWKEAYCQPLLKIAHAQLRNGAYATAWAEGQSMPLDQAMQLALTFANPALSLSQRR